MTVEIDPTGQRLTVTGSDGTALPVAAADRDPSLVRITTPGGASATFYPAVGFNLIDWWMPAGQRSVPMIHHEPDVLAGGSGTRSGHPILFPFPNRIAGARYDWDGRAYQLPVTEPSTGNAIHGFCAKAPWTRFGQSGDTAVTAQFQLSRDAPQSVTSWPGDLSLDITFALSDDRLTVTSEVTNVDDHPVPFGLGFHPYFAPLAASSPDEAELRCGAASYWELSGSIPTGRVLPVAGGRDLRAGPVVGQRQLDDVLTDLPEFVAAEDGLMERARLTGGGVSLAMRCDAGVRDVVVFTPANRESLAVEPYTCPTDAVHLTAAGKDVGWRVLPAGQSWTGVVAYVID